VRADTLAALIYFCQNVKENDGFAHFHPISVTLKLKFGTSATEECTCHLPIESRPNPNLSLTSRFCLDISFVPLFIIHQGGPKGLRLTDLVALSNACTNVGLCYCFESFLNWVGGPGNRARTRKGKRAGPC